MDGEDKKPGQDQEQAKEGPQEGFSGVDASPGEQEKPESGFAPSSPEHEPSHGSSSTSTRSWPRLPPGKPGKQPPPLHIVRLNEARKAGAAAKPAPVSQALYDAMWEAYRDGLRSARGLANQFNVSEQTATKAIKQGWPQRNWPSLAQKAAMWDQQKLELEQKAAAEKYRETVDEWYRARKQNLGLAGAAKGTLATLAKTMLEAARAAKPTKTVRRREGNRFVESQEPLDLVETGVAMQKIAAAIETISKVEAYWLGGPSEREDAAAAQAGQQASLTPEQMQFIIEHDGQLPPGVTDEQLKRMGWKVG